MHRFAAQQILAAGGSVVVSRLVPFGTHSTDADDLVDLLSRRELYSAIRARSHAPVGPPRQHLYLVRAEGFGFHVVASL